MLITFVSSYVFNRIFLQSLLYSYSGGFDYLCKTLSNSLLRSSCHHNET